MPGVVLSHPVPDWPFDGIGVIVTFEVSRVFIGDLRGENQLNLLIRTQGSRLAVVAVGAELVAIEILDVEVRAEIDSRTGDGLRVCADGGGGRRVAL